MKKKSLFIGIFSVATLISIFPTWNFSERITIPAEGNPLWTVSGTEISSLLTQDLKEQGFVFHTGRGAEADPDGICFGDFGSDEYWVIQYDDNLHEVIADVWIRLVELIRGSFVRF